MQSFPMFIKMAGRKVVIVGGGEQAAQKTRLMLKTEATIIVAAPELDDELSGLLAKGRISHFDGAITADLFDDTAMVLIGTGCPAIDASIHAIAKAAGALVNVVDQPHLCDATTPSIVDRDPVVVAIGTEGTAPVLGRRIKTQIEQMLDPQIGTFAALAGRLRGAVAHRIPRENRREFWRWTFNDAPWTTFKRGAQREAAEMLKTAVAEGEYAAAKGSICLVGAGPGARDLLTLRAVERLQEADVIFYDRLVDPDVLELARRDAERVYVGKVVGAHALPQDRINQLIVAEALKGRRVVRLKSGDPTIFGRMTEELDAACEAGIETEVVPGITAATAAAAQMQVSLTERNKYDSVTFATGAFAEDADPRDLLRDIKSGTRVVFYMCVASAEKLANSIIEEGLADRVGVTIASDVSSPRAEFIDTSVEDLVATLQSASISGKALLIISPDTDLAMAKPVGTLLRSV